LTLTPRGEFSVIIAGLATGALQIFTMYILITAFVGMLPFSNSSNDFREFNGSQKGMN